jgi:GNAT superfamily N-acetyltransferase
MFRESGRDQEIIAQMGAPFRDWLGPRLADGSYFGWIVEEEGRAIAGLGMMEIDWPPGPAHPTMGKRGYILNVYVEPDRRGQGIATQLMDRANEEARVRGLSYVVLHATEQGQPLYDRLGWKRTNEMGLTIKRAEV